MRLGPKILLTTAALMFFSLMGAAVLHPKYVADGLIGDKEFQKAEATLNSALESPLFKSDPTIYLKRSKVRRNLNDYKGSRADIEEAMRLQQGNKLLWGSGISGQEQLKYEIYLESAYEFEDEKQWDKALEETEKAAKITDSYELHRVRGEIFEQLNQIENAEKEFDRALDKASAHEDIYYARLNRAEFLWRQNRLDEAIEAMNSVMIDEKNAYVYHNRGCMYMDKGDYQAALADLDEAMKMRPGWAELTKDRAEAVEKLKQKSPQ